MNAASLVPRPRASLASSDFSGFICTTCFRRNVATFRRTRKVLRVNSVSSANGAALPESRHQDQIVFNPPSSAPNVYHTPPKFLPKVDPRSVMWASVAAAASNPSGSAEPPSALSSIAAAHQAAAKKASSPALRPIYEKRYHLQQEQIDEIRRLRAEDPRQWTRVRLAEKFQCSQFFVSLCCSSHEMKDEQDAKLEQVMKRWGRRKREARQDRQERKKLWGSV